MYVTLNDATGAKTTLWTLPEGRWKLLAAKVTLKTDATPGERYVAVWYGGNDGYEATEIPVTPPNPAGIGPNYTAYCFAAVGGLSSTAYAPAYFAPLPDIFLEQDSTALWAFGFGSTGIVGPGDLWHGTRLLVAGVS